MVQSLNLQKELSKRLSEISDGILLHCCCAACSTSCLEYLRSQKADLTLYYCNPNIDSRKEYELRAGELERYNREAGFCFPLIVEKYEPETFFAAVRGLEHTGEGGARCKKCFALRFKKSAEKARELGIKYVLSTLSVSPHKNAALLYDIGKSQTVGGDVEFLPADFKKGGGFVRGGELCRRYGVYRQSYCGCIFSRQEREAVPVLK